MATLICPLQETDIPAYARLELEAFRTHPRINMLWPRGYTDDLYAYYEERKSKSFHDKDCHIMKAVDDQTGEILGVSEWDFHLDPDATAKSQPTDPNEQPPANWPRSGNWEIRRFFVLEWEQWTRETFAGKPYIELHLLVVHPKFHRRGAGTKLLSWGCDQADKHGVAMCLESTPAGMELYKRFGFREVRTLKADMRQFGWDQPYDEDAAKRVWMVRDTSDRVHKH
ncbi:hypothetical protein LTR91_007241 [Friedmanniomyces endolithicus]|uniref:N-acetyltransferase domain-containing protein n=1 Tax=Friedmanniomyces endolithicus TaxID=329885 RepID=A0AAN6KR37_9PEZI|nr:hypothetical protein LTR94_016601 [Friedmanniomyces endolithicus]KAK0802612.1 hypothetical protein LTR59_005052 [Friedmanniomyces endolithicus]KAK0812782.1 hypothetical protein LTR75_004728 [Friedmanniomyces endolithicus]KAK0818805.1 hypothetical protein LTR38_000903 [Friedmanniomyces endolithicus]KAK0855445.1 hypothetical protein LTR03_001897 [Friedmanniomyces endolithicus]